MAVVAPYNVPAPFNPPSSDVGPTPSLFSIQVLLDNLPTLMLSVFYSIRGHNCRPRQSSLSLSWRAGRLIKQKIMRCVVMPLCRPRCISAPPRQESRWRCRSHRTVLLSGLASGGSPLSWGIHRMSGMRCPLFGIARTRCRRRNQRVCSSRLFQTWL